MPLSLSKATLFGKMVHSLASSWHCMCRILSWLVSWFSWEQHLAGFNSSERVPAPASVSNLCLHINKHKSNLAKFKCLLIMFLCYLHIAIWFWIHHYLSPNYLLPYVLQEDSSYLSSSSKRWVTFSSYCIWTVFYESFNNGCAYEALLPHRRLCATVSIKSIRALAIILAIILIFLYFIIYFSGLSVNFCHLMLVIKNIKSKDHVVTNIYFAKLH